MKTGRGNKARMRNATAMRRIRRAARYLEQEARDYVVEAQEYREDNELAAEFGKRAGRLFGAARDLREIAGYDRGRQ